MLEDGKWLIDEVIVTGEVETEEIEDGGMYL
jgi:hypothetical protein